MSTRRNPRTGIEDRWFPTIEVVDPVTGEVTKKKVKSPERYGKGMRWRARYVDPNGVERSRSFAVKADAQKFLDGDVTTKVVTGTWVDPDRSGVLFSVVAEKWFATKQLRKPKTVAGYRSLLDTLVIPKWGSAPLHDIEFEDVQAWVVELSVSGGHRFKGKGLSASRVIQAYQVLDQVLRFAIKSKRLAVNPAAEVELPSKSPAERQYLTHRQVLELAMAAGRFRTFVLTLAYTGIRFGEAAALRVCDINFDRRRITVARSATAVTGLGIVEGDTKNHTRRSVPFPDYLAGYLEAQIEGKAPTDYVFPDRDGSVLGLGEFRWAFDPAATSINLPGLVPHSLRHTAASLAISAGANIKVVQRMLGHKTATLTLDLYGHLFDEDLDPVAAAMDAGARAAADSLRTEQAS
ncbi:tyrosine-type recombinase/integrase [Nocardia neocaledoniensis]|uniref:tyrosine-type recombinase/integrase n=1 Tax=Nocardia neocaledoniensis TaxID=236511 RepID=UPI0033C11DB9